jgi:hypothetical protein
VNPQDTPELRLLRPKLFTAARFLGHFRVLQQASLLLRNTMAALLLFVQVNPQESPELRLLRPKVLTAANFADLFLSSYYLLLFNRCLHCFFCTDERSRLA